MSEALAKKPVTALTLAPEDDALFSAVAQGDLSKLTTQQKLIYYNRRCKDLGLNPLNQPFEWLMLNGKLTLYAKRQCTEELRKVNGVSIHKLEKQKMDDLYVVTAYATDRTGRSDSATGAVSLGNLKGEALANAMMKAETKAKRRVTLSICGLGLLDETEVTSIPEVQHALEKVSQQAYEAQYADVIEKAERPVVVSESGTATQMPDCESCGATIKALKGKNGSRTAEEVLAAAMKEHSRPVCGKCQIAIAKSKQAEAELGITDKDTIIPGDEEPLPF